jgi:hypothetical protein
VVVAVEKVNRLSTQRATIMANLNDTVFMNTSEILTGLEAVEVMGYRTQFDVTTTLH